MQPLRVTDGSLSSVSSANLRPKTSLRAVETGQTAVENTTFRMADGRTFTVPQDGTVVSLGRRSSNDVSFDHPKVSRHHAEMRVQDGRLMVKDTGSSYGTLLNGLPIAAHKWVAVPGDSELTLGGDGPRLKLGEGQDMVQLGSAPAVDSSPVTQATTKPAPAPPPTVLLEEPLAIAPDPSPIDIMASEGLTRRTVGWSGDGPHAQLIQRGMQAMDRVAPGFRQRLDQLLEQSHTPENQKRYGELTAEQMKIFTDNGQLMSLPLDKVDEIAGAGSLRKREALEERVGQIQHEFDALQKEEFLRIRADKSRANDLGDAFIKKLREDHSAGENFGERVSFDDAAIKKLAEKGIEPKQVKGWVNDFFHQTGLPAPDKIDFKYLDDRPRYIHQSGVINIGSYFDKKICMHELAHRIEFLHPELSQANKSWVAGRCTASGFDPSRPSKLNGLCPKGEYKDDELAQQDAFINEYVGKVYPDAATEVLSTGLEHFTDGKRLIQLYQQDPEQFFLVLGALETARAPRG